MAALRRWNALLHLITEKEGNSFGAFAFTFSSQTCRHTAGTSVHTSIWFTIIYDQISCSKSATLSFPLLNSVLGKRFFNVHIQYIDINFLCEGAAAFLCINVSSAVILPFSEYGHIWTMESRKPVLHDIWFKKTSLYVLSCSFLLKLMLCLTSHTFGRRQNEENQREPTT